MARAGRSPGTTAAPRATGGPGQPGCLGEEAGPAGAPGAPAGLPAGPDGPDGRLARLNAGSLIYGTIVTAAALAAGTVRGETAKALMEAMSATLLIYWLAHVYTDSVNRGRAGPATPLRRHVRAAAWREAPILLGGLPVLAVVVAEGLARISLWVIVLSAAGTAIGALALGGLVAGRQAGTHGWRLGAEAVSAAVFGVLIGALLVVLHLR